MNIKVLLLLTVSPLFLLGQETKKIIDDEKNETYYVLSSNMKIRNGEYNRFTDGQDLIIKGFYKLGVKDSIWESYDLDGQLTLKYNYNKEDLEFYKPSRISKQLKYKLVNSNNADTSINRLPILIGGDYFLSRQLRYPPMAFQNRISGKVNVAFTVDKFGRTSNFHVKQPLGYGLDEEAIRVLKVFPHHWLPALVNNQPVDIEVTFPVFFRLK